MIKSVKSRGFIINLILIIFLLLPLLVGAVSDDDLDLLQDEIKLKQNQITELKKQKEQYEQSLTQTRQQISTLNGQISNLDNVMAKLSLEVQTLNLEKEEVDLQVMNLNYQIEANTEDVVDYQDQISGILRLLNRTNYHSNFISIISQNDSIGTFFESLNQLNRITSNLKAKLNELLDKQNELSRQQNLLLQKKDQLEELNIKLAQNIEKMDNEKVYKSNLLYVTRGEESEFQTLINQLKAEQDAIDNEIYSLEIEARKKLYEANGEDFLSSESGFIWPVPSRKVTATFHDPDYPYRHIFEHNAIDIRASQGTPIRAAASGYVSQARVCYSSSCYSYIMVMHSGGFTTVYGHISKIGVNIDQFVAKGDIIGYSGGTPGTIGAGPFVTGPHLHFELRKNGIPVNPLSYLPH